MAVLAEDSAAPSEFKEHCAYTKARFLSTGFITRARQATVIDSADTHDLATMSFE